MQTMLTHISVSSPSRDLTAERCGLSIHYNIYTRFTIYSMFSAESSVGVFILGQKGEHYHGFESPLWMDG